MGITNPLLYVMSQPRGGIPIDHKQEKRVLLNSTTLSSLVFCPYNGW